jgi:hypothetical protein
MFSLSPLIPQKKRGNISEKKLGDFVDQQKDLTENTGNSGNSGNVDSIDRLDDSDFDSKVSVPSSVPGEQKDGNTSITRCGLGPHSRKAEAETHVVSVDSTSKSLLKSHTRAALSANLAEEMVRLQSLPKIRRGSWRLIALLRMGIYILPHIKPISIDEL